MPFLSTNQQCQTNHYYNVSNYTLSLWFFTDDEDHVLAAKETANKGSLSDIQMSYWRNEEEHAAKIDSMLLIKVPPHTGISNLSNRKCTLFKKGIFLLS